VYEGTRPLLLEVQALTSPANVGFARRSAIGVDISRLQMILAVLDRKAGISLVDQDVYINIVGGFKPDGTSTDLAVALAIYSTARRVPCKGKTIAVGEIGLTGDLRSIIKADRIVREADRMGFERIILPSKNSERIAAPKNGIKLIGVKSLSDAISVI
ncbi:MAG TPA: magnesium chelatase domain-containing protein, partial [Anaerovoracaceae bacterium]|nr:magnesium chelatase domain-containing protein [Anaerovoracaceae bacterium]